MIFTIFTEKKKIIKYFTTKTKYRTIIFFLANIFSAYFSPPTFSPKKFSHFFHNPQDSLGNICLAYFSPSTFSPKKFSHFFHNPQDSLAARLTHSLTHHTNPKKDKKNAKNATKFNHHHHHKKIHAFN